MPNIRCLLVDDEPPALALLQQYAAMIEQLEVVGTSASAIKAFDFLNKEQVDLMFLDIQMPVLNGIDFIKTLQHPPAIILTTAYREYALDGYDLDIIDYLLKPIPFERFMKAIERYNNRNMPPHKTALAKPSQPAFLFLKSNRTQYKVYVDHILYLESLKDYVRFHTTSQTLVVKGNLGSYMNQLPSGQFTRIHRSFAVANAHVMAYNAQHVQIGDQQIPVGASYRDAYQRLVQSL